MKKTQMCKHAGLFLTPFLRGKWCDGGILFIILHVLYNPAAKVGLKSARGPKRWRQSLQMGVVPGYNAAPPAPMGRITLPSSGAQREQHI